MKRTHTCGELRKTNVKKEVTLCGWVQSRRDHGGIIFIDLRDRYGITQVVFDPNHNSEAHKTAEKIRREWVLQIIGHVRPRAEGMANPRMETGAIEVITDSIVILNESETPPLEIEDKMDASEEMRLKYRYLDLRRPKMQRNLLIRHIAAQAIREYLSSQNFLEIETPLLVKTTPGGARVFKVPSRTNIGKFYSLPESPQIYKQLLMVAGCDRYFQMAKCLRDEDLRADRQPEFTQIDLEMSFADQKDVQDITEGLLKHLFKKLLNIDIKTPFQRLTYNDAISKYGSDKPDLRFGLELTDVSQICSRSDFGVFKSIVDKKGHVFCLKIPKVGSFSRTDIEGLTEIAKQHNLAGLSWMKAAGKGLESNLAKYFSAESQAELLNATKAKDGDLLLFAAEQLEKAATALGQVRLAVAKKQNLTPTGVFNFVWIIDFPLYEWNDETKQWQARHHIFTRPREEDIAKLEKNPEDVKGQLYDCVINGIELGSGSIRIHRRDLQERVLKVIGLTYEEATKRFDFLLEAFKYGAPPHGGIGLGFDRLVTLMMGLTDIREVIAFPKNKEMQNPMDGSPQEWTQEFLKELHLKLDVVQKK